MSKPTTYFVQTSQIDELVERYGSQLERMELQDKLLLQLALSAYIVAVEGFEAYGGESDEPPSFAEYVYVSESFDWGYTTDEMTDSIADILDGIEVKDAQRLIVAIANQIAY